MTTTKGTMAKGWIGRNNAMPALAVAALLVSTLCGCSNRVYDAGLTDALFGGGPPPDAPTPVRGLSGEAKSYPNVANVPGRPKDIPTMAQRQHDIAILQQERTQAEIVAKELGDIPMPQPLPVPAEPQITPGKPKM